MSACDPFLDLALDDENALSGADRTALHDHLKQCASCREEVAAQGQVLEQYRSIHAEPSERAVETVLQQANQPTERPLLRIPLSITSAAAALLLVSFLLVNRELWQEPSLPAPPDATRSVEASWKDLDAAQIHSQALALLEQEDSHEEGLRRLRYVLFVFPDYEERRAVYEQAASALHNLGRSGQATALLENMERELAAPEGLEQEFAEQLRALGYIGDG